MRKLGAAILVLLAMGLALPAAAGHTHVRMTGNGSCVILAANGGEKYVDLPGERTHPLHSNVHKGQAGMRQGQDVVWVLGSAGDLGNCDGYVND